MPRQMATKPKRRWRGEGGREEGGVATDRGNQWTTRLRKSAILAGAGAPLLALPCPSQQRTSKYRRLHTMHGRKSFIIILINSKLSDFDVKSEHFPFLTCHELKCLMLKNNTLLPFLWYMCDALPGSRGAYLPPPSMGAFAFGFGRRAPSLVCC